MIILDYQDRRPLYEQIVEKLRTLILRGVLAPDSRLPSVRQLAMDLSINPNTIMRAYMELEKEGLIYPVKGKGNFVADTGSVRKTALLDYEKEFSDLVLKGKELGVTEEEMQEMLRKCFLEEKPEEERGESHDTDPGLQ